LDALRKGEARHDGAVDPIAQIRAEIDALSGRKIQPVINATGIIVHTNLGRAPLGPAVAGALSRIATEYCTVEYDLASGQRASRAAYLEHNLAVLCGAAAATVVNNCAAALVLLVRHFASCETKNQVVISRGELIQIGGGFRIPDILQAGGAILREIGTTNVTTLDDYRRAIDPRTAMVLKVHHSNFYQEGFVQSPCASDIAAVARQAGVVFVEDLGSGATFDSRTLGGGEYEPIPADALAGGAHLVCFSGDKLLGGPQAGIIAGCAEHIAALKSEPLFRALRCDKLALAALEATVDATLAGRTEDIPIRAMMSASIEMLHSRATAALEALKAAGVPAAIVESEAQVGGGSLPRTVLKSVAIELCPGPGCSADELAQALRRGAAPVVACILQGRVRMDLRTIFHAQDAQWVKAVIAAAGACNR
jgi:L-seryl-tRNA(Ser) seleniumtransferase